MAEQTKALTPGTANSSGLMNTVEIIFRSKDTMIAIAVLGILMMFIFPFPAIMLDFLLALSIASSLIIILVSVYIVKPLEFNVFPTVLLIVTLFRLALNVATTKNILLHGAHAEDLSFLIKAFGNIVIGGNFLVGLVVFIILMIINFIVITKGAGRIAEVAARFTLDAMPGKQMSIDAELNAGHINADEARKRRKQVESEADFYGAMDGASKFVRGDAIAAMIITGVNMIIGLIVGVVQNNMSLLEASKTYTILAVGDGLISALPALMVSTAAGLIVTRATSDGSLGNQVFNQISVHPKAFYIAGALILLLSLLPGFPKLAFWALGGLLIFVGKSADKHMEETQKLKAAAEEADHKKKDEKDESLDTLMKVDVIAVEVGHGLVKLIDPSEDGEVVDRIQSLRKQFAQDLGVIVPQIQLRDNLLLEPGQYAIYLKGNRIASGKLMIDYFMALNPGTVEEPLDADQATDPVYGLDAIWITKRDKDEANFRGYTVINCATIIATHISKMVIEYAYELISRQDVQYLVDKLKETNPKVVEEVVHPDRLTIGDVVKVLQNLLKENVSVRDLVTIFETLADNCRSIKNTDLLSEQCRKALGRGIVKKYQSMNDELLVITFDRLIEDILYGGLVTLENGMSYLNLDARSADEILNKLKRGLDNFQLERTEPVLLISSRLRLPFYKLVSRYLPQVVIMSYDEIPSDTSIRNLEMIA